MTALTGVYVSLEDLLTLAPTVKPNYKRRQKIGMQSGNVLSRIRGRGLDLDEVRQYQPGDDIRNIDWKVTARLQEPHTKVFREEQERPCLFIVDQTQSMFFGSQKRLKSVLCAEIAGRLAWSAIQQKDRVGGIVISNSDLTVIKPRRSKQTVARLLQAVAESNRSLNASTQSSTHPVEVWEKVPLLLRRLVTSNFSLTFISDFLVLNEDLWSRILAFNQHNQVRIYYTFDRIERELPPANYYRVSNGSETVQFHTGSRQIRQGYGEQFQRRIEPRQQECLARGIPFYTVSTNDELDTLVHDV